MLLAGGGSRAMDCVEPCSEGVVVRVALQPRASRTDIVGEAEGRLKMRVHAPPVEGAANEAAASLLAKVFGAPKSAVRLARGHRSRQKDFVVIGVEARAARASLAALLTKKGKGPKT